MLFQLFKMSAIPNDTNKNISVLVYTQYVIWAVLAKWFQEAEIIIFPNK